MSNENLTDATIRWKKLKILQEHYHSFDIFLEDALHFIKKTYNCSEIQKDIAHYMQHGPSNMMIQAQRGQAKSTIGICFAVYTLIHDPSARIVIISAGEKLAKQMSKLIIQIINSMSVLECLKPDRSAGDRASILEYDVHHSLKGPDKSPSINCLSITSNLQGNRASLIIADDIETTRNGMTFKMRETLLKLTEDFGEICQDGKVIYLGTPQSIDSIYNSLPSRDFEVKIWPARYPTVDQMEFYSGKLSELITKRLNEDPSLQIGGGVLGDQGKPLDPIFKTEEHLQKKELGGKAKFQLQYMLNTYLSDKDKYILKTEKLVFMRMDNESFPLTVTRDPRSHMLKDFSVNTFSFKMAQAIEVSSEFSKLQSIIMYIDPAGGGLRSKDETGYCVAGFLNGNIYMLDIGGVGGGYEHNKLEALSMVAKKWKPNKIVVEQNFGYGSFKEILLPVLRQHYTGASLEDDYVNTSKEKRIISILEGVVEKGALIINQSIIDNEMNSLVKYSAIERNLYSFFFQFNKITYEAGALIHDDRLDCVAGCVNQFLKYIAIDQDEVIKKQIDAQYKSFFADPLQLNNRFSTGPAQSGSLLNKYLK